MNTRDRILEHMKSHRYRPTRTRRLARFFDVAEEEYREFRSLIKQLIREGEIVVGAGGKLLPPEAVPERRPDKVKDRVEGRFSKAAGGFGFVIPADASGPTGGEDLYIPAEACATAVTGDTVLARVRRKSRRGYAGEIVEIVERGQERFVGTVYETPAGWIVRPDGGVLLQDFAASDAPSAGAGAKDKVVFEVLKYALRDEPGEAVIVEVLGERGAPGVDTVAVVRQFNLPDEFPEEVLADARRASQRLSDAEATGREDLTGETILTIDPEGARDYDDAISLRDDDDGAVTLGVHIADVAHFVEPGAPLDEEARERGTSVYLPTMVLPMLPEVLSNGVCSLQEGRTRLTKSVFITFDAEGEPGRVRLANTLIRSAKRLTYLEAGLALEGKTGGLEPEIVDLLKRMEALAKKLLARRRRMGYLELDMPDVDLEFDDEGHVVDAHPEEASFSHRVIEMFMVEANEAVARELERLGVPFLRRVHDEPGADAAEQLKHFARSIGYKLRRPTERAELQKLLNDVRGKPEAYGIHLAVLRSLKRAEYSPRPEGHFALGSEAYCHFTSPIRRYPDLVVHRAVDRVVRGQSDPARGGGRKKRKGPPEKEGEALEGLARHCSDTERRAEAAERELTKVKLLEYLQGKIGEAYTGVITGVESFGLFVEIPHLLIDGLVHISELRDDHYSFDRRRWSLVGRRHGRVLRVGTEIEVRIQGVDIPRRKLDLEPVDAGGAAKKKGHTTRGEGKGKGKPKGKSKGKAKGSRPASKSKKRRGRRRS